MTNGSNHTFPHVHIEGARIYLEGGLSKREFFAAFAMLGHFVLNEKCIPSEEAAEKWAQGSLIMADALLAELQKSEASDAPGETI